jgi:hypothetical protein
MSSIHALIDRIVARQAGKASIPVEVVADLEANVDTGTATGGTQTTLVDTSKNWAVNMWANAICQVKLADGIEYLRVIASNTADTLTIAALPGGSTVAAGNLYSLKLPVNVSDIERWGGTQLTGRDISADLADIRTNITGILSASEADYSWNSAEADPTPTQTSGIIVGVEVDTKKVYVYDFHTSAWVEWMVF